MAFTVADALKTGRLLTAAVRAGAGGLSRQVASVNVMEVPDILTWVKPHELLLTTLYPLRDVAIAPATWVEELALRELAGLVVKTGRYVAAIPAEMCAAADRAGLPLIELQAEVSFDDIITELLASILSVQTRRLQYSDEVHRRFTSVVLSGGGLVDIADHLARLVRNPVAIVAPDRRILARSTPDDDARALLERVTRSSAGYSYLDLETGPGAPSVQEDTVVARLRGTARSAKPFAYLACPIRVGARAYGTIVVLEADQVLDDDDTVAIEHAATVCALDITKHQAIAAVERTFQTDVLEDVLAGRIASLDLIITRAHALGWDLARPAVVVVADERAATRAGASERDGDIPLDVVADPETLERVIATIHRSDAHAIVAEKSGQLVFVVGVPAQPPGVQTARAASIEVGRQLLRDLHTVYRERDYLLGVGRAVESALDLYRSYDEARQAIAIGSRLTNAGPVIHFDNLGFHRVLAQFEDRTELALFADEMLGALDAYDRRHGSELLLTLETLLTSNLNMTLAARRLHLHYNSLRYRLQKIEELAGPCMDDAHQRMNLELALYIRRMRD